MINDASCVNYYKNIVKLYHEERHILKHNIEINKSRIWYLEIRGPIKNNYTI